MLFFLGLTNVILIENSYSQSVPGRIDAALISIPGRSSISSRALVTHRQQPCSSFEPTRSSSSSSSSKQNGQNGVNDSSSSYRAHTWALWRGADAAPVTAPVCCGSLGRQHQAPATSTAEYKPSVDNSGRGKTTGHVERAAPAHTRQWSSDDSTSERIRDVGGSISRPFIASQLAGETSSVGYATPASAGGSIGQQGSDAPTSKGSGESIFDGLAENSQQHSRDRSTSRSSTAAAVVQPDIHAGGSSSARSSSSSSSSDPQGSQLSLPGPTSSNTAAGRRSSSSTTTIRPSSDGGSSSSSSYNSTGAMASRRKLLQTGSPVCPVGCQAGSCIPVGTGAGFRCQSCKNNLVVNRATGLCACPAGRYLGAPESCVGGY